MGNDEQRKLDRKTAAQEKLAKTFTSVLTPKKRTAPITTKKGGMVELMKIKSQAKGQDNVPATCRIYIYVQHPKESKSTVESIPVYFDKVKRNESLGACSAKLTMCLNDRKFQWAEH